jgi:dephospho-CoA kinase
VLKAGLTGGIGSGKSTVSRLLAARGAVVVDADLVAREVVEPGSEGLAAVVSAFGEQVLRPDGALDRAALGQRVFADPEARATLNGLLHPRIAARSAQLLAETEARHPDGVLVHDVPLLVENGLVPAYDVVVVVDTDPEVAVRRLVEQRGMTEVDARARVEAQATRSERLAVADEVVRNDGPEEELAKQVEALWERLQQRRTSGRP